MFGESTPLIDVHAFGFDWNQRILIYIRIWELKKICQLVVKIFLDTFLTMHNASLSM